ncbi:ABC transporter ATP-binding protein [Atopobacter phocae]|uniref:ABC transporter ATP-binding protein n=1 Tax=Atopobacter phocae TaxID=136492 RepID=UPI00046E6EE9|nr:ATP-binding cassette domain-containing protein [Atopobacter phocae]
MTENILSLTNIQKTFGAGTINENHVLKGLSIDIRRGDFITVIGGNGAGKSTLMNMIAGTLFPDAGELLLKGEPITRTNATQRAKWLGRVFQDPNFGTARNLKIEENLAIALSRGKRHTLRKSVTPAMRNMFREQLAELNMGLEDRLETDAGFLSGGQRQVVTLMMAVLQTPELLLLDEHTAALDPRMSAIVMELTNRVVQKHQLTTLMITHDMSDALKYGNRLIMLHKGRIALDLNQADKANLTMPQLLDLFYQSVGERLSDDSLLLA